MADDAVHSNQSQAAKFPANRENNWEYFDIWLFRRKSGVERCAFSASYEQIPYEAEQGIIFSKQGTLSVKQGILKSE